MQKEGFNCSNKKRY